MIDATLRRSLTGSGRVVEKMETMQMVDDLAWQRVRGCDESAAHSLWCGAAALDALHVLSAQVHCQLSLAAAHNDTLQEGIRALQASLGGPASSGKSMAPAAAGASSFDPVVRLAEGVLTSSPRPGPLLRLSSPRPPPSASSRPQEMAESMADILQLERRLWSTAECRRRSRVGPAFRAYRLLPSSLPPGAYGPPAPHDLYSYLCLKEAIRACTPVCRNARDKLIRFAKHLDTLDLSAFRPQLNPLVLVHGEVLAAIRAQSARVTRHMPPARGAPPPPACFHHQGPLQERTGRRSLADLGVGSLVRLALQLQAAMLTEPFLEWFAGGSPDSF